jgi:CMP-N-acetylneuraminic acid synthetase
MQAIVPIKSHSERVPNKNFRILGGKPLFEWIIHTLLTIEKISQIVIDTDSDNEQLWKLDEHPRIQVKSRRPELRGDFVSMNKIIQDVVETSSSEVFLMTHATNPFLSRETINKAIQVYSLEVQSGHDSLFSVSPIQGRLFAADASPLNHDLDSLLRTQDLDEVYLENSCLYIFSKECFRKNNNRIGQHPYLLPTPILDSIDIDTMEDWNYVKLLADFVPLTSASFKKEWH